MLVMLLTRLFPYCERLEFTMLWGEGYIFRFGIICVGFGMCSGLTGAVFGGGGRRIGCVCWVRGFVQLFGLALGGAALGLWLEFWFLGDSGRDRVQILLGLFRVNFSETIDLVDTLVELERLTAITMRCTR